MVCPQAMEQCDDLSIWEGIFWLWEGLFDISATAFMEQLKVQWTVESAD